MFQLSHPSFFQPAFPLKPHIETSNQTPAFPSATHPQLAQQNCATLHYLRHPTPKTFPFLPRTRPGAHTLTSRPRPSRARWWSSRHGLSHPRDPAPHLINLSTIAAADPWLPSPQRGTPPTSTQQSGQPTALHFQLRCLAPQDAHWCTFRPATRSHLEYISTRPDDEAAKPFFGPRVG